MGDLSTLVITYRLSGQLLDEQGITDANSLIGLTLVLEVASEEHRQVCEHKHLLVKLVIDGVR